MIKNQYIREVVLNKEHITSYEEYPFSIPTIRLFEKMDFPSNITFLAGENGVGKSTFLEAIAVNYGFNAEGGSINFNFHTKETHSSLSRYIKLVKGFNRAKDGYFFRSDSYYNVISEIENLDEGSGQLMESYGGKSLHKLSHGESILSLMINRFSGNGLYILDEPESGMSPNMLMSMITTISDLSKNSQFIIATHSPILLAIPDATIYELSGDGFERVEYTETNSYKLTKEFLQNFDSIINILVNSSNE